jgi:hypothetical protein
VSIVDEPLQRDEKAPVWRGQGDTKPDQTN